MVRNLLLSLPAFAVLAACGGNDDEATPYRGPAAFTNVLANRDTSGRAQNETTIAVSPLDHNRLAGGWNDYRTGEVHVGYALSQDGGATWVDGLVDEPDVEAQGDPAVAAAADGTFYMAMISFSRETNEGGIYVAATTPDGSGFQRAVRVQSDPGIFEDKEYVAVDNSGSSRDGTVYVTWTNFDDQHFTTQILLSRSTDRGETWSQASPVSAAIPYGRGYVQGSMPAVGLGGELFVTYFEDQETFSPERWTLGHRNQGPPDPYAFPWRRLRRLGAQTGLEEFARLLPDPLPIPNRLQQRAAGPRASAAVINQIVVARSVNGGLSFEPPVRVANVKPIPFLDFRTNSFPSIAISHSGPRFARRQRIHVGWAGGVRDNPPHESDVFVAVSEDHGRTFRPPVRVNDDPAGTDQIFPWIAADDAGALHAVWYDRRDDPRRHRIALYHAKSLDGGRTFQANRRVGSESFDPDTDFGGSFIGDYNGLAAAGGTAFALWTDARRGGQDAFFAPLE